MPDLKFSPFLSTAQQLEQQRQIDLLNSIQSPSQGVMGGRDITQGFMHNSQGAALDESLIRLNQDLPAAQPLYTEE